MYLLTLPITLPLLIHKVVWYIVLFAFFTLKFIKDLSIFVKSQDYKERERERVIELSHLLAHSPDVWVQEPKDLDRPPLPSQHISRELHQKCSKWDMNWCPFGMPVPQVEDYFTIPLCQLLQRIFKMTPQTISQRSSLFLSYICTVLDWAVIHTGLNSLLWMHVSVFVEVELLGQRLNAVLLDTAKSHSAGLEVSLHSYQQMHQSSTFSTALPTKGVAKLPKFCWRRNIISAWFQSVFLL